MSRVVDGANSGVNNNSGSVESAEGAGETGQIIPQHTHPLSFAVRAIQGLRSTVFPMFAVFFAMRAEPWAILAALAIGTLIFVIGAVTAYVSWRRFTYVVGEHDIRVESGILARAARSVPYERVQDVSLEQELIPRFFKLVTVKFETGAGGADELTLSYLTEEEGERLRELIKARKDEEAGETGAAEIAAGEISGAVSGAVSGGAGTERAQAPATLFAMNVQRLLIFGFFEFSLAAFAVIAGLFQYVDGFIPSQFWDADYWVNWFNGSSGWVSELGLGAQILGILAGLFSFLAVGSMTGIMRVFLRDWGFVLERTEKGFRRRRGLLTRTDVVMPVHRVQALKMRTGFIRRKFGWHSLAAISLAQDSGSSDHEVAPFGQIDELRPIANAAGFAIEPQEGEQWLRGSRKYRIDRAILKGLALAILSTIIALSLKISEAGNPAFAFVPLGIAVFVVIRELFLWRYDYNAIDAEYFFIRRGWFSQIVQVASRVKLQSVEIVQGPVARRRGYASLRLGLAGGEMSVDGLPVERAEAIRSHILESITATDFSELME